MALTSPNLDDRTFETLLADARALVRARNPQWTDLSPGDPGITLLEAFAFLTDVMIYRLNRLPEKVYVELLRLIGVTLEPPSAAEVKLRFATIRPPAGPVVIPLGTRVSVARASGGAEAPVFVTTREDTIDAAHPFVDVPAYHCELVDGELLGVGSGKAGETFYVSRPPMVSQTGDARDLRIGVEIRAGETAPRGQTVEFRGKLFRVWTEVRHVAEAESDALVYLADRAEGRITFVPGVRSAGAAEDAHLPLSPADSRTTTAREIRAWYRRGGGAAGNLPAGTLTVLRDPLPGVVVTNPGPATGGGPAESLASALHRAPRELYSLERAVTARDFEHFAERSSRAIARAKAITKAALWTYAAPGTVEVLIVPAYLTFDTRSAGAVTADKLREQQTDETRRRIRSALNERRPLGTNCDVSWVRYKTVSVSARVVVQRGEDSASVKARIVDRLHQVINPLPTPLNPDGWRFGQPLRQFDAYEMVRQEPGVRYVDSVSFSVEDAPDKGVSAVAHDRLQPSTWYAAAGDTLYRSLNDGQGWEVGERFSGETIRVVRPHPEAPGVVAMLATRESGTRVYVSSDLGDSWRTAAEFEFAALDLAWMLDREAGLGLLVAAQNGLYELSLEPGGGPVQIDVDPKNPSQGFYAVATVRAVRGAVYVAVASMSSNGVYVSDAQGRKGTFAAPALAGEDIRVLRSQRDGPRTFLWAGTYSAGNESGKGCFRLEPDGSSEGWRPFAKGWVGGSCRDIGLDGSLVWAATHHAGVAVLDVSTGEPEWHSPGLRSGLPLRSGERIFQPVDAVSVRPATSDRPRFIASGGAEGVHRSVNDGSSYEPSSRSVFSDAVTLPATWLFCSGAHRIETINEDDAR
jgi:hypothetical protein